MSTLNKPILITGATGFVGSYLTRFLVAAGYQNIICLRREKSSLDLVGDAANKVTWVVGDVLDLPLLEDTIRDYGVQRIFHCAAVVSFDPRDRDDMYTVNVEGTANVVNVALEIGIEKLVHMSSIAAIGRVERQDWVSEENKWQRSPLNTHYAISKYQAEQEVWRGVSEGLTAAIVNPSVILGAQFWHHGTGKLFEQVWSGLRFYTEGATGYVDVRDVVRFMVLLMNSPIENQRFILNGENIKYKNMFESIALLLGKKPANIPVTPFLRALAWRVEWVRSRLTGKRPLITKETAKVSATTFYFRNEKSLNAFPDFQYTPIEKTLKETAKIFLDSQNTGKNCGILPLD